MNRTPIEFDFGGVYLPPLLIAALLALVATTLTAQLLNRVRLSQYFFYPPLVYLALAVLYTVIISTYLIPA